MWDETLIESMGKRNNGKRWFTVQVAAIFHAAIVAILVAASFWYSDAMTLPAQSQPITGVFFAETLPTPPALLGVKHTSPETPAVDNSKSVEEVTQNVVPEGPDYVPPSTQFTDVRSLGNLPVGDPHGIPEGTPNGSGNGGFGPGGNGIGIDGPIKPEDFIKLRVEQPVVIQKIDPIYPPTLLRMHKEGVVILQALITGNGDVQKIEILRSDHPLFSQSAFNAVTQWKYRPAKLNGKPVAVYFTVTVMFRIK